MAVHDITRFLHRPQRHYAGVRMQQGRLLLDSDFNESTQLHDEDRRRALIDLMGPGASPDQGFSIGNRVTGDSDVQPEFLGMGDSVETEDLQIGGQTVAVRSVSVRKGSFYLGGHRLDLERPEHIAFQSDFLQASAEDLTQPELAADTSFRRLYYLHAWEQAVTAVEDDEIREVALGGEDTSVRMRRMKRVELFPVSGSVDARVAWRRLRSKLFSDNALLDLKTGEARSLGRLQIKLRELDDSQSCGRCNPDPSSGFLGSNNLTLRVLLTSPTTFVWALDNSAPLYRVIVRGLDADPVGTVEVEMLTPPADEAHFPLTNRVVEIVPFGSVLPTAEPPDEDPIHPHFAKLAGDIGAFTRVLGAYDPNTRKFTIDTSVGLEALKKLVFQWDPAHPFHDRLNVSPSSARHFYLRVWHEAPTPEQVELPIIEFPFPKPADGKLTFDENDPRSLLGNLEFRAVFRARGRRGDYWTVALRPDAPEPVVPFDMEFDPERQGAAPHGPRHFYAPLAIVGGTTNLAADIVTEHTDVRPQIRPLSDRGCITFSVGDGVNSFGDFTSIQAAIESLPEGGGHIAVRPGVYRELLTLIAKEGVVLEGCGESTILEPPLDAPLDAAPLIDIVGGSALSITGFTLRTAENLGVHVHDANGVTLSALTLTAGVRIRSRIVRGALASNKALVLVEESSSVRVSGVVLEPDTRPGLVILISDDVTVSDVTGVGTARSRVSPAVGTTFGGGATPDVVPVTGIITVAGSKHVTVRDSLLSGFGQSGVVVNSVVADEVSERSEDVTFDGLSIVVSRHRAFRTGRVTSSQSGINIDGATRVQVGDSSIVMEDTASEHTGIVIRGTDVLVRGNRVEALARCFDARRPTTPEACRDRRPLAFGGIQIRGGSVRVQVRDNDIAGGIGHGITLGSVFWRGQTQVRREGAGRGQVKALADETRVVTGVIPKSFKDGGLVYQSRDEGRLREIVLSDNRIEQMFGNGISVLSVLGMPLGQLIDIDRIRIERNTIVGNVVRPAETIPSRSDVLPFSDSLIPGGVLIAALPLGGIVLATVTSSGEIRANLVQNNGSSNTQPHNGIFVLNGDGLVIAENRVTNNGGRANPDVALRPGIRAGIAVMLAGTGSAKRERDLEQVVRSPDFAEDFLEERARGGDPNQNDGCSLRVYNNTVLHPEGRALYAVATGPVAIDGNSFGSLGNHGANTVADMFGVGEVVFVMNVGPPWEKKGILESHFTTYATPFGTQEYLAVQPPPAEGPPEGGDPEPGEEDERDEDVRYSIGDGGGVLFNHNQVTYDWAIRRLPSLRVGAPISFFPVALLSLDHVGLEGNQFAFRPRGLTTRSRFTRPVKDLDEPVLAHVFTLGATVQTGGNRFSESVRSTILSMLGIAELMITSSYSQSTHQIFLTTSGPLAAPGSTERPRSDDDPSDTTTPVPYFVLRGAQVMFASDKIDASGTTGSKRRKRLRKVAKRFLELLLDR